MVKRFSIALLGVLLFSFSALSQIPGREPGWWLDNKATDTAQSKNVTVKPKVKIITQRIYVHDAKHHINKSHHIWRHHRRNHHLHHHCRFWFLRCWK